MWIASEMREYFKNLLKPLVTNESLQELLRSFQENSKRIRMKCNKQNKKEIIEVSNSLATKMLLEKLKIKYDDDNEQYSRRSLLSYSCH